jgi:hypothetical protein
MKRKNVLSISADAKTIKGQKLGFLTGILYFAPSEISGFQVCPSAKLAQCEKACLYTAGRGAFNSIQAARIAKTKRFFNDRDNFMLDLIYSINALIKKAEKLNLTPLVRLNGTSDIAFENIYFDYEFANNKVRSVNIFQLFNDVQFYDYTKIPTRKNIPANYDLTFSYSGVNTFAPMIKKAALNDKLARIAVVFDKIENIPSRFLDREVLLGDNSDVRHMDAHNSIVALYAKGKAKNDYSGFIVRR